MLPHRILGKMIEGKLSQGDNIMEVRRVGKAVVSLPLAVPVQKEREHTVLTSGKEKSCVQ